MKDLIRLLKLTLTEKKLLVLAFVCILFVAVFSYVFVDLIQPIIDKMFLNGQQFSGKENKLVEMFFDIFNFTQDQLIYIIPVLLVIVMFGRGLFTFLSSFLMKSVGLKIVKQMRDELYEKIVYQSASYFDKMPTGEILSRVSSDVDKIQEAVSGNMGEFIREACILIALLIYVFSRDWEMALTSFVVAPMALIPLAVFSKHLRKVGKQNQIRMAQIFRIFHESITGHKIIKAFTMEKFELKKFFAATKSYLKTGLKLAWIGSLASPFMEFMGGILAAFILAVGSTRIARGIISPGEFGSFLVAIFLMYMPFKRLSRANNAIQHGIACHERVLEIMNSAPKIVESPKAFPLPRIRGHIQFENVSFTYDGKKDILQDVSFEAKPLETLAIVGLSGAGKTTLINLISRFYDPTAGRILIDGYDIQEATLSSLRSQIGLVSQDVLLFDDTIMNNIAYGMTEIPIKRIIQAAKTAKAHDFIKELPDGYDSAIGEKGALLSSGQCQRIAIARALLKDPPLLVLDEATSALDSKSEKLIQMALANIMKKRTTFVIAHRLSTIRNADKILVLDKANIAEIGSHSELYRRNGIYKKLYDLQFKDAEGGIF
jgi:subfamily B ATP-binding cassette protein MsbA